MVAILMTAFILELIQSLFDSPYFILIFIIVIVVLIGFVIYLMWREYYGDDGYKIPPPAKPSTNELMRMLGQKEEEIRRLKARIQRLENPQWTGEPQPWQNSRVKIGRPTVERRDQVEERGTQGTMHRDYSGEHDGYVNEETQATALCRLYNEGVHDLNKRTEFRDKYRITRISTTNVDERRRNPNLDAIFQTSNGGEFYVIEIQEHGQAVYAAVPQFDLEINDLSYMHGAAGKVFDCHGYQAGGSYRPVRVIRPAHFRPESGSNWSLQHSGELEVTRVSR